MPATTRARADLHCHSRASRNSRLGVQRAVGLPECATAPEEVYALAKRRGMAFVTITDHDTLDGVLEIADRPDVFVSEELTARFAGEARAAVHVLCWGITPDDHAWLQAHAGDVERCAAYLHDREIACALAHPFYAVEAPLAPRHRRALAELFPVWETRNGSRAAELNLPAALYVETRGAAGTGGSDDHAGIGVGLTFSETPHAPDVASFLAHLRAGRVEPGGAEGSAVNWAHAALVLAARVLGADTEREAQLGTVVTLAARVLREGDERRGSIGADLGPDDARALLRGWLRAVGFDGGPAQLLALARADAFDHAELYRRSRAAHEQALREAVAILAEDISAGRLTARPTAAAVAAAVTAVPYAASTTFLSREKAKVTRRGRRAPRVGLVADAIGATHGVARALAEIRTRGVEGFDVEVIGTDANVDRRLAAVDELEVPFYAGLRVGVPSMLTIADTLAEGHYDILHVCAPGPAGLGAALFARLSGVPLVGSYHTDLEAYAALRAAGHPDLQRGLRTVLAGFYGQCDVVLSPGSAADAYLGELGIAPAARRRWARGVDGERFAASGSRPGSDGRINVLYCGRLAKEKGVDLLADAFLAARRRDPHLRLVLAGDGPERARLEQRLGPNASFLGWLDGEPLSRAYADADLFIFPSATDTFGQVVLEAQASALPVVAVARGGPLDLIEHGQTGWLCAPEPADLADALGYLAARPRLRAELGARSAAATRARSWEHALAQLADGYRHALADGRPASRHAA